MKTIKQYFYQYKHCLLIGSLVIVFVLVYFSFQKQSSEDIFTTQSLAIDGGVGKGRIVTPRIPKNPIEDDSIIPIDGETIVVPKPPQDNLPIGGRGDRINSGSKNMYEVIGSLNNEEIVNHINRLACLDNRNSFAPTPIPFIIKDKYITNWLGVKSSTQEKKCACYHNAVEYSTPTGGGIERNGSYFIKVKGERIDLNAQNATEYCMNGLFVKNASTVEFFGSCLDTVSHIGYGRPGLIISEIPLSDFNNVCPIDDGGQLPEIQCIINAPDKADTKNGYILSVQMKNIQELSKGGYYIELSTIAQGEKKKNTFPVQLNPVNIEQKPLMGGLYIHNAEIKQRSKPGSVLATCQKTVEVIQSNGDLPLPDDRFLGPPVKDNGKDTDIKPMQQTEPTVPEIIKGRNLAR